MRLVALPFHDWHKFQVEGFRTRDAHLLQVFDRHPRVESILVIDRPVSRAERVIRQKQAFVDGTVVAEFERSGRRARLTKVGARTTVLDIADPSWVRPALKRRRWWFDVFEEAETIECIRWAIETSDSVDASWIAWHPAITGVVQAINPNRLVFDSLDNWLIHPTLRRHSAEAVAAYATILPRADRVFASGPASVRVLERWRPDVTLLPNGVDLEAFTGLIERPADLPASPIVGYAGKLAQRIDDELVAAVARELPDVQFVFVGPVLDARAIRAMRRQPNVQVLGDRPYRDLPAYLRSFDIAWIPHRVGPGETGGDPIKLYEYWAAGRQVLSTRIDGSESWTAQARLVDSAVQAAEAIRGLFSGVLAPLPTAIPAGRTWDAIASVILGDPVDPS